MRQKNSSLAGLAFQPTADESFACSAASYGRPSGQPHSHHTTHRQARARDAAYFIIISSRACSSTTSQRMLISTIAQAAALAALAAQVRGHEKASVPPKHRDCYDTQVVTTPLASVPRSPSTMRGALPQGGSRRCSTRAAWRRRHAHRGRATCIGRRHARRETTAR